jgi:hypothetical protein
MILSATMIGGNLLCQNNLQAFLFKNLLALKFSGVQVARGVFSNNAHAWLNNISL